MIFPLPQPRHSPADLRAGAGRVTSRVRALLADPGVRVLPRQGSSPERAAREALGRLDLPARLKQAPTRALDATRSAGRALRPR